ncbi:MAG: transporter substrate-binding domain-containing protein [Pseudomonadales bacterium]|nr:transporter substrate-binding domain-containing protein [Pseudomonadales bacterium]PCJ62275.1 MAG: amino acid ABC transporter substrate-binding protein [Planctomycetota bacterium]
MKTNVLLILLILGVVGFSYISFEKKTLPYDIDYESDDSDVSISPETNETIKVVTEDWKPFSFIENDVIKGSATNIVRTVLDQSSMSYSMNLYPWARSYKLALSEPNVLIFAIVRTKERENLFRWVGPVAKSDRVFFYKLKSRKDISAKTIDDLKELRVGAGQLSNKHIFLQNNQFKNITLISPHEATVKHLLDGQIDLIVKHEDSLSAILKNTNVPSGKLEMVLLAFESEPYMAFSNKTSDEVFNKASEAYKKHFTDFFKN